MVVFICGYFGFSPVQNDGQTIKTRLIKSVYESIPGNIVTWVDTQRLKTNPIFTIWEISKKAIHSNQIVMLPGMNGLKLLFPFLYLISKLKGIKINYIVIGGWLPDYVKRNNFIAFLLKKIDKIMVETQMMNRVMQQQNFTNTMVLNNFKPLIKLPEQKSKNNDQQFKTVYVSRILREKGIFELISEMDKLSAEIDIVCDFYGPIDPEDKSAFLNQIALSPVCRYQGILSPDDVVQTIQQYELFIFPTYYHGEGFPGALIDAMNAGTPILASNWRFNKEIVQESINGFLYDYDNFDQLAERIKFCASHRHLLNQMEASCLSESLKYDFEYARRTIINTIPKTELIR